MAMRKMNSSVWIRFLTLDGIFLCFAMSSRAENQPPQAIARPDEKMSVGVLEVLAGTAIDDGLPSGILTYSWTLVCGNASGVEMTSATGTVAQDQAYALVTFSEVGEYTFRLTVDDGELQASDDATITVVPDPPLTLMSPIGGETLIAGQIFHIQWSTVNRVEYVYGIFFSPDNGATWEYVEFRYIGRTDPDWGDYSWTVPDSPSTECLIRIEEFAGSPTATSAPFEILTSGTSSDADGDGMPTAWETTHGLDPDSAGDAGADADRDDLTNLQEFLLSTDPNEWDTDGDGFPDGAEVSAGYDPTDPLDTPPGRPPDKPHVSGDGCIPGAFSGRYGGGYGGGYVGGYGGLALLALLACAGMLRRPAEHDNARISHRGHRGH